MVKKVVEAAAEQASKSILDANFADLSILMMFVLAMAPCYIAYAMVVRRTDKFDQVYPRGNWTSKATATVDDKGIIRRLGAAHSNGLEALLLWTGALLFAMLKGVSESSLNSHAKLFILARTLYIPVYALADTPKKAVGRPICFFVGTGCACHLLYTAAIRQSLRDINASRSMLQEQLDKAKALLGADSRPVRISDVIAYAQKISGTVGAPSYWRPGMPMIGFRPPAPLPEMMRAGKLMGSTLGKQGTLEGDAGSGEEGRLGSGGGVGGGGATASAAGMEGGGDAVTRGSRKRGREGGQEEQVAVVAAKKKPKILLDLDDLESSDEDEDEKDDSDDDEAM